MPLAADLPDPRRERLIADAGLRHIVSAEDCRAGAGPDHNPDVAVHPAAAAYVNYTSGSTGQPKGVLVPQQAVVRLVRGANYVTLDATTRLLHLAPLSFDAATFEIWGALLNGGSLAVMPPGLATAQEIGAEITARGVTTLWLTAGLFAQVAEHALGSLGGVRQLLAGGDVLPVAAVRRVKEAHPGLRLINGYGPTENTTFSCCYEVPAAAAWEHGVPIGVAISNTQVAVLDAGLEPVPVGAPGELYVSGAGLARGYLNQAAVTAERFVADPHGAPGTRMYRTGDLVRWRGDGVLEFLGRADAQVKLRGFRIEPGEIETELKTHPQVRDAIVTVREDGPGGRYLAAYVVPSEGAAIDADELRAWLGHRLPDYMIPTAFVEMDAMPLTANGKIDRSALPAPRPATRGGRAAGTPKEQMLCDLFSEVLSCGAVNVDDNFFALGGHSLLASQLIARIRTVFRIELPIRALFDAPTVAALSDRLPGGAAAREPLVPQPRPARLPLSYAQARLWFLHRLEGRSATYNVTTALRLHGALDVGAFSRAVDDVVARHESLRTIFPEAAGTPYQEIIAPGALSSLLAVKPIAEDDLPSCLAQAAALTFDLMREIPFRAWLFCLAQDRHVLLLLVHHIAADGWSLGRLLRDLTDAYAARVAGRPANFTALPVQYADYVLWQRHILGDEEDADSPLMRQLAFWQSALAGIPGELMLPYDRPRPPVASYRGSSVPVRFDASQQQKLYQLAQSCGASLFMVLQAGLALLLCRMGAGNDIPIGTVIAGRGERDLDDLVGCFVNSLVLRTDLSGNPSFRDLVARVRAFDLEAFGRHDVPFEKVVDALEPARSLARHPLFQVMLVLQNLPLTELDLPGLVVTSEALSSTIAKFDLAVTLSEYRNSDGTCLGIDGVLEYNLDLFEPDTAASLAARFEQLVAAALAYPNSRCSDLPILTTQERSRLLAPQAWHLADGCWDEPVHLGIARQAALSPDDIAVQQADHVLTYRMLEEGANRLAHRLRAGGARPGQLVGIATPRSPDMVIGLYAILKTGAAYLPVDPDYPPERIDHMVRSAGLSLMLVPRDLRRSMPDTDVSLLPLDSDDSETLRQPPHPLDQPVSGDSLIYGIFTSGSAGSPKLVGVHHRSFAGLVRFHIAEFGLTAADRCLLCLSFSFDAAQKNIFAPLLARARLVLAPHGVFDPEATAELISQQALTWVNLVPSMLYPMVRNEPRRLRSMRNILVGGEPLLAGPIEDWLRDPANTTTLTNVYGPTECTDIVAAHRVTSLDCDMGRPMPIGKPLPTARILILDAYGNLVPPGGIGEITIGGACVGAGYLNDEAATAARFVHDPFADGAGARLYASGDMGRLRLDGVLECLGRTDQQLKIRGYRIEPGEIESALMALPDIDHAAVIAREDAVGGKQLIAYVVPKAGATVVATALRAALSNCLPNYMVPQAFVALDALPTGPSGKLDRRALPMPDVLGDSYLAPRTPQEEILCGIFARLLSVPRVGIDDNFFTLGGHSLMAIRLVSEARAMLGVTLPVRRVFEAPTVAQLAQHLGGDALPRPPLVPQLRPQRLPLSYAQMRLWFLHRLEGRNAIYNIPFVLRLDGEFDADALRRP